MLSRLCSAYRSALWPEFEGTHVGHEDWLEAVVHGTNLTVGSADMADDTSYYAVHTLAVICTNFESKF